MKKHRHFTVDEIFRITEFIHLVALQAIGRVKPNLKRGDDLVFQGGTALHLCHGSARHSVDLDFLISSSDYAKKVVSGVQQAVRSATVSEYGDCDIEFRSHKANDAQRNPQLFDIRFRRAGVLDTIQVKLEFFVPPVGTMLAYERERMTPNRSFAIHRLAVHNEIPTGTLQAILADKLMAVGGRKVLKYRDIVDIDFCLQQLGRRDISLESPAVVAKLAMDFANRVEMYSTTSQGALALAAERLKSLDPIAASSELSRHMPSAIAGQFDQGGCTTFCRKVANALLPCINQMLEAAPTRVEEPEPATMELS